MKRRVLGVVVFVFLLVVPSVAQGAACTGICWLDSQWRCGFTAFQEGAICQIVYDYYGQPVWCVLYACPATGGWIPENQGRIEPQERFPWEVTEQAAELEVQVTVVPPRS